MSGNPRPALCPFCGEDSAITMPNDRAQCGVEFGIPGGDAFYCHCEGCGADGPIAESHGEAIQLWNRSSK